MSKMFDGYHGSVSSYEYKDIWNEELKLNPHLFKTHILSIHPTWDLAVTKEAKYQKHLKVDSNPLYINKCITLEFGLKPFEFKRRPIKIEKRRKKTNTDKYNSEFYSKIKEKPKGDPIKIKLQEDDDEHRYIEFNDFYLRYLLHSVRFPEH